MTHSTVDTRLTGKEQIEHIRAEAERRKKLIPFDWRELPRIDWPFGETHAKSFDGWIIVQADGRKISVQEFHQNFIYAGSLMGVQSEPTRYLEEAIGRAEQLWPSINIPRSCFRQLCTGEERHNRWQGHQLRLDDVAPRSVYR